MKALFARWVEALGPVGTVGIGLIVFCAAFYFGTIRPGEQRLANLHSEQARLERVQAQRAREGGAPKAVRWRNGCRGSTICSPARS